MAIYLLDHQPIFPNPDFADKSGIVAVGGDLSVPRLLEAYANGIFPWYSDEEPIIWWSPDPRCILFPEKIHVSRSMKKLFEKKIFSVTYDTYFEEVINECQRIDRFGNPGTWITDEMKQAYLALHYQGYAHSVEVWKNHQLAGGLYGISIGKCFFGESMFSRVSNASKFALIYLANTLMKANFHFIDCQIESVHLASLGAEKIKRKDFLKILRCYIQAPAIIGSWRDVFK
jgi:leucyl/phenylalanyl-tRNA--protein transferase